MIPRDLFDRMFHIIKSYLESWGYNVPNNVDSAYNFCNNSVSSRDLDDVLYQAETWNNFETNINNLTKLEVCQLVCEFCEVDIGTTVKECRNITRNVYLHIEDFKNQDKTIKRDKKTFRSRIKTLGTYPIKQAKSENMQILLRFINK